MGLLNEIINCEDKDVKKIIDVAIENSNNSANKIEILGFENGFLKNTFFKGFIPLDTRVRYESYGIETYSMKTTDFFYKFALYIKENNINNGYSLICGLEKFINSYFGFFKANIREEIFNDIAFKTTKTDEEYFAALEKNEIGYLKGKNAAMCTERTALAQQILSIFGFEVYYCIGCIGVGEQIEPHAFNIVKRKNDYAILDYTVPAIRYDNNGLAKDYYPFIGILSEETLKRIINNQESIKLNNYYYVTGNQKAIINGSRSYVIGSYEMDNKKSNSKH